MERPIDKTAKPAHKPRSAGAERVRRHREKMKAMGLKPVTIWVPDVDVHSPEFKAEIKRQCELINNDPHERRILDELENWFDPEGWK
jgi:hypothetical protein